MIFMVDELSESQPLVFLVHISFPFYSGHRPFATQDLMDFIGTAALVRAASQRARCASVSAMNFASPPPASASGPFFSLPPVVPTGATGELSGPEYSRGPGLAGSTQYRFRAKG